MKLIRTIALLFAVALLGACSTSGGLAVAGLTGLAAGVLSPSGADPDNQAYLNACVRQFEEQAKAEGSTATAISTALTGTTDPATKASLVMLIAVKSMQAQPFRCSIERRKGFLESFTGDGLLNAGLSLYGINRNSANAKRQLESGDYRYTLQMDDAKGARQQINDLVGTKPDEGYTSRREADADFVTSTTPAAQ